MIVSQIDRNDFLSRWRACQQQADHLQASLHQTEDRLRIVSDLMYDYACSYHYASEDDDNADLEWVVGAFEQITGHSIEKALSGFSLSLPVIPADVPIFSKRQQKLHSGQADVSEFRIYDSEHKIRWLRSYGRPEWDTQHKRVVRIYIGVQDITQQKEAEEALRRSEVRFSTAFRNSPVPMVISTTDPQNPRYVEANAAYLQLVGYSWEELTGQSLVTAGVAIDDDQRTERLNMLDQQGHYMGRDARIRNRAGETLDVIITAQRLQFDPEEYDLEIILDVTERKKLADQVFRLAVETERVKVLSLFAQNASHELRTPLSVISSSTFLMTRSDDAEQRQTYAARINREIARLTHLLDLMLTMTRLDAGVRLNCQPIRLNNLIHQVAKADHHPAIRLNFNFDPALPPIKLDLAWLRQALDHLLDNAFRYTPDGGTITISTAQTDGEIRIEIADTGIGISPAAQEHIFERFWRLDEAHSTPGFGLGLSLAQKIVELHDGTISVSSELNHGSTFTIHLPIQ
ncbi:MAG TPA: PAS domain-containing sensor histidine kinase [Phototrophicaceae bacterium]|nr:PAS domain-containing sensor histidine kinase [Phototrophicaceae bacterium]